MPRLKERRKKKKKKKKTFREQSLNRGIYHQIYQQAENWFIYFLTLWLISEPRALEFKTKKAIDGHDATAAKLMRVI